MFAAQDVPVTAVTAHTVKNKQGLCTMSMTIVIKTCLLYTSRCV